MGLGKSSTSDESGRLRRAPLPSPMLIVAEQFLLLRIDRDHGPFRPQRLAHLLINELEVRLPIGMIGPFRHLPIRLQAIPHVLEQMGHRRMTDGMAGVREHRGEPPRALARPAQGRGSVVVQRLLIYAALESQLDRLHSSRVGGCSPVSVCATMGGFTGAGGVGKPVAAR